MLFLPLPGFPAFRLFAFRLSGFPAFRLPCFSRPSGFPTFQLPDFSPPLLSSFSLRLRPLPEPPVFCPLRMEWRGRGPCPDIVRLLSAVCFGGGFTDTPGSARFGWNGAGEALSPDVVWLLSVVGALCGHPGSCTSGWGGGGRKTLTGFRCELRRGSARRPWRAFGASRGVVPFGGRVGPRHGDGTAGHEKKRRPQCGERRLHFAFCWLGRAVFRQRAEAFPAAVGCHRLFFGCGDPMPDTPSGACLGKGPTQTVIISFSLRSRTPSSSLVNFSSSFCVCVSPSFDSSSGIPSF